MVVVAVVTRQSERTDLQTGALSLWQYVTTQHTTVRPLISADQITRHNHRWVLIFGNVLSNIL